MQRFQNPVPAAKLREHTDLRAKYSIATRWSSTIEMIRRYVEIRDYMTQVELDDIDDLLLPPRQDKAIDRVTLRFADLDTYN